MGIPVEIVGQGIDWPAWVQAVGSVAAIGAAVIIAKQDENRHRTERRETRKEFRASVAALARRLADLIAKEARDIAENSTSYAFESFDNEPYKILDAVLERFDPSKMDSVDGALAIERIRRAGHAAPAWAQALAQELRGDRPGDEEAVATGAHRWAMEANEAANVLENLARKAA